MVTNDDGYSLNSICSGFYNNSIRDTVDIKDMYVKWKEMK